MDRITVSMLNEFIQNMGIVEENQTLAFEYFTNYSIICDSYGTDDFDYMEISTGEATPGIDGIGIIVNQKLVSTTGDIDELIALNQTMAVKFVIIQAKTSPSFDNKEISNLFTFSNVFFGDDNSLFNTDEMQKFIELKNYIFDHGNKLRRNPELCLYYVTLGTWNEEDRNLTSGVELGKKQLLDTNLFSSVEFYPIGATEIQTLYRKTKEKLTATFEFGKRVTMYTESSNSNEVGYCGVIPFSEFKKLLLNDSGAIKPVFEDNIRDYLGPDENVNTNIKETLKRGANNSFCMLNNGVVVVASSINISGDNATIEDYQIVNGCQTCNVLLDNMDVSPNIDKLMIPVRIIATQNENLKNDITRATNSQTAIKKEQLEALSTFQKNLEEYYKTYKDDDNDYLVYERRSGQSRNIGVAKNRIVTIQTQIKTVAAMFLDQPGEVSGQYGTVARKVGDKIFKMGDKPIIYYTSSLTCFKIENLFRTGILDKKYRRCRFHAMMLFRMAVSDSTMPPFNSKKMEDYCQNLLNILKNDELCKLYFKTIVDYIISVGDKIDIENRKCFERKETAKFFIDHISDLKKNILANDIK